MRGFSSGIGEINWFTKSISYSIWLTLPGTVYQDDK